MPVIGPRIVSGRCRRPPLGLAHVPQFPPARKADSDDRNSEHRELEPTRARPHRALPCLGLTFFNRVRWARAMSWRVAGDTCTDSRWTRSIALKSGRLCRTGSGAIGGRASGTRSARTGAMHGRVRRPSVERCRLIRVLLTGEAQTSHPGSLHGKCVDRRKSVG
jgi:hypothetical protein